MIRDKIIALKHISNESTITIRFNWAKILFYTFFMSYGYFGALTPNYHQFKHNILSSIITLCYLTLILICLGLIAWKASDRFQDVVNIEKRDIYVFGSYFAILSLFQYKQLQFSLFGDEIFYSTRAFVHGTQISLALARKTTMLDAVPFQYLVQIVSLLLLVSLLCLFFKRLDWKYRIIIFSVLLFFGRLIITAVAGNPSPHPPLSSFPPFIFGSLFGITDISCKLSYLTIYVFFTVVLYRMMLRVFDSFISYLLALAIGTIPLLWHLGAVVEQSLWTSICFTVVMVEIITSKKLNCLRLTCFISIATLMRQPSFLAIAPVIALFLAELIHLKDRKKWLYELSLLLAPTLLFIPYFVESLFRGYQKRIMGWNDPSDLFGHILSALDSDIILIAVLNSVPYWWVILIPFAFIPLSRNTVKKNVVFLLFLSITISVYYSIEPGGWGFGKYQAEYAVPFAISGMLFLALRLSVLKYVKHTMTVLISILILLNIADFVHIPQGNKKVDVLIDTYLDDAKKFDAGYRLLCAFPYNYHDAYETIKKNNLSENSYTMGVTYSWLPEVMNGYSAKAIRSISDIWKHQVELINEEHVNWTRGSVDTVERDNRINVVLLGHVVPNKQELIDQFKNRNWSVMGEYKNNSYGSTVVVMRRPLNE
ncbi:MAG: hypothetical protein HYS23_03325 [Geobacter sp.]|nr:hypothetical protein [Geobacter sp.]